MLSLLLLTLVVAQSDPLGPGQHTRTVSVDGLDRTYLVHVPKSYDAGSPHPVVLVLHGGGSNAK
jgi:polyhydroxybutyrate depolymerase